MGRVQGKGKAGEREGRGGAGRRRSKKKLGCNIVLISTVLPSLPYGKPLVSKFSDVDITRCQCSSDVDVKLKTSTS